MGASDLLDCRLECRCGVTSKLGHKSRPDVFGTRSTSDKSMPTSTRPERLPREQCPTRQGHVTGIDNLEHTLYRRNFPRSRLELLAESSVIPGKVLLYRVARHSKPCSKYQTWSMRSCAEPGQQRRMPSASTRLLRAEESIQARYTNEKSSNHLHIINQPKE